MLVRTWREELVPCPPALAGAGSRLLHQRARSTVAESIFLALGPCRQPAHVSLPWHLYLKPAFFSSRAALVLHPAAPVSWRGSARRLRFPPPSAPGRSSHSSHPLLLAFPCPPYWGPEHPLTPCR